jgi:glycopeptide antibiotics resistance protein
MDALDRRSAPGDPYVVAEAEGRSLLRRRRVLAAIATAYAVALAIVLFWPTHVDGEGGFVRFDPVLDALAALGIPAWASYPWVEFAANAALFVPLGVLWAAAARTPRLRRAASAALIGAGVSIVAELGQRLLLDERTTDPRDVVANTLGAVLGALATVFVLRALSAGSSARRSGSRPAPRSPWRARSRRPRAPARGA